MLDPQSSRKRPNKLGSYSLLIEHLMQLRHPSLNLRIRHLIILNTFLLKIHNLFSQTIISLSLIKKYSLFIIIDSLTTIEDILGLSK